VRNIAIQETLNDKAVEWLDQVSEWSIRKTSFYRKA
jgi:hypothetical protein